MRIDNQFVLTDNAKVFYIKSYDTIIMKIKPECHRLDYPKDPHYFYEKLQLLDGFVLLESADRTNGRYDIISALPYDRIQVKHNETVDASLIQSISHRLKPARSDYDLPFQGGAIGYISYDFGAQLHGIFTKPQSGLAGLPILHLGFYDWAIIVDHHQQDAFLFAANRCPKTREIVKRILGIWQTDASIHHRSFELTTELISLMPKQGYYQSFHRIKSYLKQGRCYQVNLTQAFQNGFNGDAWAIYQNIRKHNAVPFGAYLSCSEAQYLSFSPERFILHDQGCLLTSPIKGSGKRSSDPAIDIQLKNQLATSEKNRAENVMIVDLMRNDLARISKPGSVRVEQLCEVQSFKAVHHLVSHIRSELKEDITPFEAFMSCFPGGSITGAPKLEAMKVIAEEEGYGRGVYCGSICYFSNHGRFDSNIAIRTITARDKLLNFAAGGGLVIDSTADEEYLECFTKLQAILNGLKNH